MDTIMLTEALAYAERGRLVFPCRAREKRPATRRGFKDATTDTAKIRRWWRNGSDKNVAIRTGIESSLVVLDVDPRNGGDATLGELIEKHGALPNTITAETGGGGFHLLFAHPGGHVKCRKIGPGLDVKSDGGYIVAPPSVHPDGGEYRWKVSPDDMEAAALPVWLLAMLQATETPPPDDCWVSCGSESLGIYGSESLCHNVEDAIAATIPNIHGRRNGDLFRYARHLKAIPVLTDVDVADLRPYVRRWYENAKPYLSGKHSFDDCWADFAYGWKRVKYPIGSGPMADMMTKADETTPPACTEGYDETTRRLVCLCRELQRNAGDGPFFINYRTAGQLLGIDRNKAGKRLNMLCVDGVLELVSKGHTGRSSEYRYSGD